MQVNVHTTDTYSTEYYPPKFELEPKNTDNRAAFINGMYSIVIYLGLGYLLLNRWDLLLIIFGIVLFHEAGHFFAMKYYRYADVSVLFFPFIGGLVKGSKKEISQRQNVVILLAGPLPGMILGILLHFISIAFPTMEIGAVPLAFVAQLLIWTNLVNLLPIYPLDGGQLLNRIFFNNNITLTKILVLVSSAFLIYVSVILHFYLLLILPALLLYKFYIGNSYTKLDKEIEASGIDVDKTYEELTDQEYWTIRTLVIQHTSSYTEIPTGPPFEYCEKEEKLAIEIDNCLQQNLILDISSVGKILLLFFWILLLLSPWIFNIDFLLLKYLVR